MGLIAVFGCKSFAVISYGERQEVILDIRVADASPRADEPARLEVVGCPEPVTTHQPGRATIRPLPVQLCQEYRVIGWVQAIWKSGFQVILEVLADTRQVVNHVDAERRGLLGRANSGELQQVRGIDRTA